MLFLLSLTYPSSVYYGDPIFLDEGGRFPTFVSFSSLTPLSSLDFVKEKAVFARLFVNPNFAQDVVDYVPEASVRYYYPNSNLKFGVLLGGKFMGFAVAGFRYVPVSDFTYYSKRDVVNSDNPSVVEAIEVFSSRGSLNSAGGYLAGGYNFGPVAAGLGLSFDYLFGRKDVSYSIDYVMLPGDTSSQNSYSYSGFRFGTFTRFIISSLFFWDSSVYLPVKLNDETVFPLTLKTSLGWVSSSEEVPTSVALSFEYAFWKNASIDGVSLASAGWDNSFSVSVGASHRFTIRKGVWRLSYWGDYERVAFDPASGWIGAGFLLGRYFLEGALEISLLTDYSVRAFMALPPLYEKPVYSFNKVLRIVGSISTYFGFK